MDGFHHPKAARDAAGRGPEGFYRGSYRYADFRALVVDPVRDGLEVFWSQARKMPEAMAALAKQNLDAMTPDALRAFLKQNGYDMNAPGT